MRKLGRFKYTMIFAVIWLACLVFVLATSTLPTKYAATEAGAKSLERLHECSGEIYLYDLGYRCDAYSPSTFLWIIIMVGIVSIITAIVTCFITLNNRLK